MNDMAVDAQVTARWLAQRDAARTREALRAVEQLRARLPAAVGLLRERYAVTRARLFGSFATGAVHAESDVDLLVEGLPAAALFKATADVMPLLGTLVHLVRAEEAPTSLLERVDAEGVEL